MKPWERATDKLEDARRMLWALESMHGWKLTRKAPRKARRNLQRALKAARSDVHFYERLSMAELAAVELDVMPEIGMEAPGEREI